MGMQFKAGEMRLEMPAQEQLDFQFDEFKEYVDEKFKDCGRGKVYYFVDNNYRGEVEEFFSNLKINDPKQLVNLIDQWFEVFVEGGAGEKPSQSEGELTPGHFLLLDLVGFFTRYAEENDSESFHQASRHLVRKTIELVYFNKKKVSEDDDRTSWPSEEDLYDALYNADHYTIHQVFSKLGKYSDQALIDEVLSLTHEYGSALQASSYYIFNTDPEYSIRQLLKLSEYADKEEVGGYEEYFKKSFTKSMIFQLSVGVPSGSDVGDDYLDDLYEMAGFDQEQDDFLARISGNGDVGVFNHDGELTRYINVRDWKLARGPVEVITREISIENFFQGLDELSDEERERFQEILGRFKENYLPFYQKYPLEKLGAEMANASIREQMWFINYFLSQNEEKQGHILDSIKANGEVAFRSIALFGANEESVDELVEFCQQGQKTFVSELLYQLSGVASLSSEIDAQLLEVFKNEVVDVRINNQVVRELERQAVNVFSRFLRNFKSAGAEEVEGLLKSLQLIKSDVILFGALCRTTVLQGELKFEQIKGTEINIKQAAELTSQEKEDLYTFFHRARQEYDDPTIIEKDITALKAKLDDEENVTSVYQLKHKGELVAFMRFDQEEDGSMHVASLNNSPDAANSGIGMAFLEESIKKAAQKAVVKGEVALVPFLIKNYTQRFGFVLTGVEVDPSDGEIVFDMRIDKGLGGKLEQAKKDGELDQERITVDLSNQADQDWITNELKEMMVGGAVIREVITEQDNKDKITLVIEKVPDLVAA